MILKTEKCGLTPGIAKGLHKSGKIYNVIGGDLCFGEKIEVVPSITNPKFYIIKKLDYKSVNIFKDYFDKDGLIEITKLKEVPKKSSSNNRIYE